MDCQKFQKNKHEIIINSKDINKVFQQIVLWGEANWWPKNCTMKFIRIGNASIQKGTLYRQEVLLPFAPTWLTLVTNITEEKSISRRFLDGLLDGEETVSILPYEDKLRIQYFMDYRIKGRINNLLWNIFFRAMHDKNIKLILNNLKDYLEK